MIEYKYNKKENKFTENGHTMFEEDVLRRLKRLSYLEEQIKQSKLHQPTVISAELCSHNYIPYNAWKEKCNKCGDTRDRKF